MNWQAINFDWNQARAFLATAEEGSLTAAARVLKLTQPTLGRQISALEEVLGVVLFERTGRHLILTVTGKELLGHVRSMAEAANRISLISSGQSQNVAGKLRITASDIYSMYLLPPFLEQLRVAAPRLVVDVVASNTIRDLQRREADIAIRHVRPEQPELIARLVREATAGFYASESYIDRKGKPASIDELQNHDFISFGEASEMVDYLRPLGIELSSDNFVVGSESGIVSWELARRGLGIAVMDNEVASASRSMVRVLPDMKPIVFPVWLTTHKELHTSRKIRLVFDMLAEFVSSRQIVASSGS